MYKDPISSTTLPTNIQEKNRHNQNIIQFNYLTKYYMNFYKVEKACGCGCAGPKTLKKRWVIEALFSYSRKYHFQKFINLQYMLCTFCILQESLLIIILPSPLVIHPSVGPFQLQFLIKLTMNPSIFFEVNLAWKLSHWHNWILF